MKKAVVILIAVFVIAWSVRILSINQSPPATTYYEIGDKVKCGNFELEFIESHVDDPAEFEERFGVKYENTEGDYKMISICIDVKNISDKDISIDDIYDKIGYGYESAVWRNGISPEACNLVNVYGRYFLSPGDSMKIWFLSEINKISFKKSIWEKVNEYQYIYIFTYIPQRSAVRIKA